MRSQATALLLVAVVAGCEHKSKKDAPADKPIMGSAAKPAGDDVKPEPVAKEPPKPSGDEVRPPVAADLADYTKELAGSGALTATIETSLGAFHCALYGDKAPMTVANFVGLATGKKSWVNPRTHSVEKGKPFFDGLTFHRVIPGFMIQGGDPLGVGSGGPGYEFADEVNNGLAMQPGTLAMANAGPATNGSQFFITHVATPWLNMKHTIFGQVVEGQDIVNAIGKCPKAPGDKPNPPITYTVKIEDVKK